MISKQPM